MTSVIQIKRGTASSWTSANTVLAAGEVGFETDTKKMKVGDGSTAWTSLSYTVTDGDITGVTAGTGISGGGSSGAVTLSIDTATTVDKTTAQTLTNKTLTTPIISSISNTGTLTLPTSTDTLVGRDTTDTLTNKTLTSPVLTTPSISTMTTTGDILYASSTSTPARLGIGSTGNVLTVASGVPSWATPAAAGGGANFTLLNSGGTALSGTSTSITGISGQDKLLILVKGASHGSAFDYNLEIQFNTNTSSVYTSQGATVIGSSASAIGASSLYGINTTSTAISPASTSSNAGSVLSAFCLITGCNSAGIKTFTSSGGGNSVSSATDNSVRSIGGIFDSSATISSVQIKFGGGTFDAGTVFIYGSA